MVLHTLQQSNAQTTTLHKHPTFAEEAQQELQSSYAERSKPLLKEADVLKARHNYWMLRRAQDVVLSFLALVVLSPLFLLICLAVWLDDPKGSPIFSQERIGWRGKPFKLYKFRTMCVNAESMLSELMKQNEMDGPVFKIHDDPRVTRVGKLLRRTSLDELPQLLNILKGDMSFVGPRPHKAHVALQNVQQLRQLVQAGAAKQLAYPRHPRVIVNLEHRAVHLVLLHQLGQHGLGVYAHGTELI